MTSRTLWCALIAGTIVASACGGSNEGQVEAPAPETQVSVVESQPPVTEASSTTSEAPASTEAEKTLDITDLPGRLAFVSYGCQDGFGALDPEDFASMTPEEIMSAVSDDMMTAETRICLMDPDGENIQEVMVPDANLDWLAWSWDQKQLLFDGEEKSWAVSPDGSGLVERNPFVPPVWGQSPDGLWRVSQRRGEAGFWLRPANATRENPQWRQVTFGDDDCCDTAGWSPDSRSIVYTVGLDSTVCAEIWVTDIADGATRQVTGPGASNESESTCPTWGGARFSPDGSLILFVDEGIDFEVGRAMLVAPDGTGLRPLIVDESVLPSGSLVTDAVWSPDGSVVAVFLIHDMGSAMYLVSVDGEQVVEVPNVPVELTSADGIVWAPGA